MEGRGTAEEQGQSTEYKGHGTSEQRQGTENHEEVKSWSRAQSHGRKEHQTQSVTAQKQGHSGMGDHETYGATAPQGLEPLAPALRCLLRSGVAVGSAAQAVEELVLNAVDAGATCVAVRCDLSTAAAGGRVQVVDNGNGITRADLSKVADRCADIHHRSMKLRLYESM
jgi:hypothetical protein